MRKIKANGKISVLSKLGYGMGEMTFGVTNTIISVYLLITLTDYLDIQPGWASFIVFFGMLWDALTDPVVGWLSDNSGGKLGRRRRYILLYALPLGISFILLWTLPNVLYGVSNETLKVFVVLVLYLFVITFLTLVNVPYGSVIMDMTDDYDERTSLTSFRMVCSAFATLGAIFIADTILGAGSIYETGKKLYLVGIVFGVFVALCAFLCYLGTFERRRFERPLVSPGFSFKKYVLESWKSKPFRKVAVAYLCAFTVIGLLQTLLQYYTTYWLRAPELFVVLAGGVLLLAIISTPLWSYLSKKLGKRNAFLLSSLLGIVALTVIFFVEQLDLGSSFNDLGKSLQAFPVVGYVGVSLLGVAIGGIQLLPFRMMPDAINVSMKVGDMDEGAYYGIVTFVQKIGIGSATLLIGFVLQLANYENPSDSWSSDVLFLQSELTNQVIRALFVGLSIVVILIGAISVLRYTVDKGALHEKIKEHKRFREQSDGEKSENF